jgi:hypothetical protein
MAMEIGKMKTATPQMFVRYGANFAAFMVSKNAFFGVRGVPAARLWQSQSVVCYTVTPLLAKN